MHTYILEHIPALPTAATETKAANTTETIVMIMRSGKKNQVIIDS